MHNVRSLKSNQKFNEIETIPKVHNRPTIIGFTETWLEKKIEQLYKIQGYNAEYNSRNTRGGGLALYVRQDVEFQTITNTTIRKVEIIEILKKKSKNNLNTIIQTTRCTL